MWRHTGRAPVTTWKAYSCLSLTSVHEKKNKKKLNVDGGPGRGPGELTNGDVASVSAFPSHFTGRQGGLAGDIKKRNEMQVQVRDDLKGK